MEYISIITLILATVDGMVLLSLLDGDQVCTVNSIGRFICGHGKHTSAHNRIFGLLGKTVGYQLPTIAMVTEAWLAPWFYLGERYQPIAADLAILQVAQEMMFTEPVVTGDAKDRPKVSVQNLVMIPKAWETYFMEPQPPWGELPN